MNRILTVDLQPQVRAALNITEMREFGLPLVA